MQQLFQLELYWKCSKMPRSNYQILRLKWILWLKVKTSIWPGPGSIEYPQAIPFVCMEMYSVQWASFPVVIWVAFVFYSRPFNGHLGFYCFTSFLQIETPFITISYFFQLCMEILTCLVGVFRWLALQKNVCTSSREWATFLIC